MLSFLFLLGLHIACHGSIIPDFVTLNKDSEKYFYFPGDGDNLLHFVNIEETVDVKFIEELTRGPRKYSYWLFTRKPNNTQYTDL
ncbi:unnamed protein product [Leptidea sinapis]|uniref:Uncharacterized protein n=1 Tax=Leptidea sinapis TaxID=189913 RepID=A0A5E4QCQ8_9NEOP|nr:unnamed protein product [Leptidea sinapis]